jgi:prefoldin subunit 5
MEMYYTKKEYNEMKRTLTSENNRLKKQITKLQAKLNAKTVIFEPDFDLTEE